MTLCAETVIPRGDLILVTGVNGYVSSNVADQALTAGYRVRGTVRNIEKYQWLQNVFDKKYGVGRFELAEVPDLIKEGVSGVAHVATVIPLSTDPAPYIPNVTALVINALKSAAKEPRMKRFVLTSSSMAAADPASDTERTVTVHSWNEKALKDAWEEPFGEANLWNVYGASKANGEREAFRWVEANKPPFVFNSILPNTNFGPTISREHQGFGSTGRMLKSMYDGKSKDVEGDPPQYFVDVRDTARLHVIALTNPGVKGERLFSFAAPYNWNIVLGIFRKMFPNEEFPEDRPNLGNDISHYPNERAEALLRAFGRPGCTTLEQSIKDTLGLED